MSAGLVSPELCLLGLHMAVFSLCPYLAFSLCFSIAGFHFSSYINTSHIGLNPTLVTSFNHYYLFKSLVSKYSHILRYGGLEFQFMNFEGTQIHSITPWILIFYLIASFCLRGWCSSYLQSQPEILFFSLLFCLSTLSLFVAVSVYICFYRERCFEVSLWAHGFSYIQCFY